MLWYFLSNKIIFLKYNDTNEIKYTFKEYSWSKSIADQRVYLAKKDISMYFKTIKELIQNEEEHIREQGYQLLESYYMDSDTLLKEIQKTYKLKKKPTANINKLDDIFSDLKFSFMILGFLAKLNPNIARKIQKIEIENRWLPSKCPRFFEHLTHIKEVRFTRAHSFYLPFWEELFSKSTIRTIYLSGIRVTHLMDHIAKLKDHLESLTLKDCSLERVPDCIRGMKELKSLDLSYNKIDSFWHFRGLPKLETLSLAGNQLESMPSHVFEFQTLKSLNLSQNDLSELPEQINKLTSLESLNLSENFLTDLPASLKSLKKLNTLRLAKNLMRELPQALKSSLTPAVKTLSRRFLYDTPKFLMQWEDFYPVAQQMYPSINSYFEHQENYDRYTPLKMRSFRPRYKLDLDNFGTGLSFDLKCKMFVYLRSLDPSISKPIKELDLSEKKLKVLPAELFHITEIEKLDLSHNEFRNIPKEISRLTNLVELNVRLNYLRSLPNTLGQCTQLKVLNLSANKFQSVSKQIGKLPSLESLNLSANDLNSTGTCWKNCKNLKYLDLSSNYLYVLNPALKNALVHTLVLSSNRFNYDRKHSKEFFGILSHMKNLRVLHIKSNYWNRLPADIKHMTKLEELYLDYNRIKSLPQVISTLDNLKMISMYHTGVKSIPEDFKGEVKRETKKVDFIFGDA